MRLTPPREFQECLDKAGEYTYGNVAKIKTVNRQRDIVIRRLINRDLKIITQLNRKKL